MQKRGRSQGEVQKPGGRQTLEEMVVTARTVAVNAHGNEKQRWKTPNTPTAQH